MLKWINSCDADHKCREVKESGHILPPSHLLDVRDPERVVLHDTKDLQARNDLRYAALSHCWGVSRRFLAAKATLGRFQKGFSIFARGFPKTFADAVLVARALRIPYLWVDSLCITQDDKAEWDTEASQMTDIYLDWGGILTQKHPCPLS